jgi:hypothetical protein
MKGCIDSWGEVEEEDKLYRSLDRYMRMACWGAVVSYIKGQPRQVGGEEGKLRVM